MEQIQLNSEYFYKWMPFSNSCRDRRWDEHKALRAITHELLNDIHVLLQLKQTERDGILDQTRDPVRHQDPKNLAQISNQRRHKDTKIIRCWKLFFLFLRIDFHHKNEFDLSTLNWHTRESRSNHCVTEGERKRLIR